MLYRIAKNSVELYRIPCHGMLLNSAEFRNVFFLCGITQDFWKLPRRIRSNKRTALARESGLFDEKNEGKKSLDTVTKVLKVLICYRKSVIDLI
jgi:hypothetical protein